MVEIMPQGGAAQFAYEMRELRREVGAMRTARNAQYTKIYDEDGNLLGELSAEGLRFFDLDGDPSSRLDGDGITVYDDAGQPITELSNTGLTVFDNLGAAQLQAGNLDGAGDYGVEVAGGRLRAVDFTSEYKLESDVPLTSTPSAHNTITITPPSWATVSFVTAQLGFQMNNGSGGTQRMYFRVDVDGDPGSGLWSNWVPVGMTANTSDSTYSDVAGNDPFDVEAIVGVNTGTNNNNYIRLGVSAIFLR